MASQVLFGAAWAVLLVCCALCLYRIARGPTAPDRAMAIDILGIVVVCFTVLMALKTGRSYYLGIGIAWAVLSFMGVIALAKHLEGRGFDE